MGKDVENDILVSVIVPVYNVAPYLEDALNSVLDQTYEHLEIIIIDDGSTDGSGEICDEYRKRDNRIHVVHQENKGLSAARNAGLDHMSGAFVAFLDLDDLYHPEFIRTTLQALERRYLRAVRKMTEKEPDPQNGMFTLPKYIEKRCLYGTI